MHPQRGNNRFDLSHRKWSGILSPPREMFFNYCKKASGTAHPVRRLLMLVLVLRCLRADVEMHANIWYCTDIVVLHVWPEVGLFFWFSGAQTPQVEGKQGTKLWFDRLHFHIKRVAENHWCTGLSRGDIREKALPFKALWLWWGSKHISACGCVCSCVSYRLTHRQRGESQNRAK